MGYGETDDYGNLKYKQDQNDSPDFGGADDKKHFQAMANAFPVKELLEAEE